MSGRFCRNTQWVGNGADGIAKVKNDSIDIVLLDLLLPGIDGIQVLKKILKINPSIIVIMISGHGTIPAAWEAAQSGAYAWLEKPFSKEQLFLTVRNAIEKSTLLKEREIFLSEVKAHYRMVGISSAMKEIYRLIDKVAPTNMVVLITGETGVGKELVANAIHLNSKRASAPFVCVNCAAVPDTLIESELFGHKKGAFTNAVHDVQGKFQLANRGTLFLDEIGNLSIQAQAKILRTIETGEFMTLGSEKVERVDVRLITATNKDLHEMITNGSFREDLFHRINVIEIHIPPLRDRPEDILPIADYFLELFCTQNNVEKKKFSRGAVAVLLSHPWPGNVRELRNFTERVVAFIETQEVSGDQVASLLKLLGLEKYRIKAKSFKQAKESFEKCFILQALSVDDWDINKTAKTLGMPRSSLYQKIEKYGLNRTVTKI